VTYTVGIYSPGKAFVVYEMSRQVCEELAAAFCYCPDAITYLANSSIACDYAL